VRHKKNLLSAIFAVALIFDIWVTARAQTEITLDTPLPTKDSFEKILPGFEAKTGYKVKPRWGNARRCGLCDVPSLELFTLRR
jgi:hypothetical protein